MTFRMWYEEVKQQSYAGLTAQEKNSMEYQFLEYLRGGLKSEPAEMQSVASLMSAADGQSSVA